MLADTIREFNTLDLRTGMYLAASQRVPADDELTHLLQPPPGQEVHASLRAYVGGLTVSRDDCLFVSTAVGEALIRAECFCEVGGRYLLLGRRYLEVPG